LAALKMAYQKPDDETMLRVVMHKTELREVKQALGGRWEREPQSEGSASPRFLQPPRF
jgi:hypothetical protein